MGGHDHHREGHKSSRSGSWEGFDKMKQALDGLATAKGVSQSRIGAVAKLAAHYSKFYKHVVHDIEMFLWKAEVEHRLAGLYAIDAIIRHSHANNDPKESYVKRFFVRMSDTIAAVKKVPEQLQPKVRHVIDEWQKRGIYTSKQIEDVGGREYLSQGQSENLTPRTSPGKLASLLSIIKQKREENEQASEQHGQPRINNSHHNGRLQKDNIEGLSHQSYSERQLDDKRSVGIMGDAPNLYIGSNHMQRNINERPDDCNDRDLKKARGSRWGPPKMDKVPSNDRPTPVITSSERDGNYRFDNSSVQGLTSGSSYQPSLLQTPHGGPPRHEDWNRNTPSLSTGTEWPRDNMLSPQQGGLIRQNANPFQQGGMQPMPFTGSDDRRSPGHRVPGTSGEVCRNYLAGRCSFGDRCWHIHDPQAAPSVASRSEFAESKHKTVLCNNFPLGTCRFGDKCSFAHGEEELEKSKRYPLRPTAQNDALNGGRWQPSPGLRQGMEPTNVYVNVLAPSSQARSYGNPQVYNEQHGDRGIKGDDSSVSYAKNATSPSLSVHRLPPQVHSAAPPPVYQGSYPSVPYGAAIGSMTFANQGPSYSNGDQDRTHVSSNVPVLPSPASNSQSYGDQPTPSTKVLADDDEVETAEPEFTLEYDDDD
ncbi:RNA polymerase II C-terminal domain-binding protein RA4, contains RPR and RRM domains [Plasmopara halstedii]|uniref:RNA polymerase II C-terminal domain-binding protein RA4, contains RPR and RRM domains n=1 Tax=Plasmopara halstedii TaxID=4781 RepID=A0A0N7L5Q3_PLAHL|nr:RNA polymerase II C-terminal domain-binding protein RA4, contains RPR and RRM domains [Plasmopara halstedii]CEG42115.1 RNA polymerase II C-terminal domain-binding protein RA4, contains RPR and RRM domains [Plasmopara halstedii]|eukprot:XP_024578484.1 RNA polymerase II C-terminal domain-binding protein RA4, contains RPR and RRM domains [Plasmopara halstedii]